MKLPETPQTPPSEMTPVEIDSYLSEVWNVEQTYRGWAYEVQTRRMNEARRTPEGRRIDEMDAEIAKYLAVVAEARAAAVPFEAEFSARGGWLRYFIVNNTGGHVHRGMDCSTCYPTTRFGWLIDLADCDEAAMVAEYGEMACTVCFPDAPTMTGFGDGTSTLARYSAAEKAERAAAKQAKADAKAAKSLVEPIRVTIGFSDTLRTIVSARNWLKSAIDYRASGYGHYETPEAQAEMDRVAEALRLKGVDVDTMIAKWERAAQKENAR